MHVSNGYYKFLNLERVQMLFLNMVDTRPHMSTEEKKMSFQYWRYLSLIVIKVRKGKSYRERREGITCVEADVISRLMRSLDQLHGRANDEMCWVCNPALQYLERLASLLSMP